MNLKFLLIPLLLMSYTSITHAEGLDISYKVPFVPLEIVFGSDGISFKGTKTIITPIGSFSLGYSKYASKFDEDYTYVIIEDMNQKKEHIYKIKDKKKLKLVSEGRTEITITKNRVHIIVEKGSRFTVKFSVDGEDEVSESLSFKWFTPIDSRVKGKKAKELCRDNRGRLPTIEEWKRVVTDCGGTIDAYDNNRDNNSYQSCYKGKGLGSGSYWSSTGVVGNEYYTWNILLYKGLVIEGNKHSNYYVRCVRDGQ